ncbi:MAG TPA: hypothetical protein DDY91_10465, partial [Planctomycetaceae bacterium]|nr:hypothetical protein [Planctomycetaceae bacterium]
MDGCSRTLESEGPETESDSSPAIYATLPGEFQSQRHFFKTFFSPHTSPRVQPAQSKSNPSRLSSIFPLVATSKHGVQNHLGVCLNSPDHDPDIGHWRV